MQISLVQNFRADINGLRALAVLAVVLYHFDVPGFAGGFVGVDVFFVISGFLMTKIIVEGLRTGRFSLWNFYAARVRRIVPALAALCLVLLVYGVFWLTPPDFERLGRHAASSIGFASNIVYWKDVDYFGNQKYDQWLLHTWSLSVEWQFYLLFPVMLMAVSRLFRRPVALTVALVVLLTVSLGLSATLSFTNRIPAFYLLPTRAWEMLAGGVVFMFASSGPARVRSLAGPLGLLLIALSMGLLRSEGPWPGYLATLPVAGAGLVLWANYSHSRLLCNPVAQFLGDSSYSIYLWHWPLTVLLHQYVLEDSAAWTVAAIAASVVLGHASLRWIETPSRLMLGRWSLRANGVAFGLSSAMVASAAGLIWAGQGLPERPNVQRFAEAQSRIRFANIGNGWCFVDNIDGDGSGAKDIKYRPSFSQCHVGDPNGAAGAVLWGDSHAAHYSPFVAAFAREKRIKVHELSSAACPPLFDTPDKGVHPDVCAQFQKDVLAAVNREKTVIIAGRWDWYMRQAGFSDAVESTLRVLTGRGADVVVLGQSPLFFTGVGKQYVYATVFGRQYPAEFRGAEGPAVANRVLQSVVAKVPGVRYVEPTAGLCNGHGCQVQIDGVPAFFDANHMNIAGAEALARRARSRGLSLFEDAPDRVAALSENPAK